MVEPAYYHYDALGSTAALTDQFQVIGDEYQYKAWGEQTAPTADPQPYRWVGELGYRYDEDTNRHNLRRRDYDTHLAQFLSQDPPDGDDDPNGYRYAHNNPTNTVDPSGKNPCQEMQITIDLARQGLEKQVEKIQALQQRHDLLRKKLGELESDIDANADAIRSTQESSESVLAQILAAEVEKSESEERLAILNSRLVDTQSRLESAKQVHDDAVEKYNTSKPTGRGTQAAREKERSVFNAIWKERNAANQSMKEIEQEYAKLDASAVEERQHLLRLSESLQKLRSQFYSTTSASFRDLPAQERRESERVALTAELAEVDTELFREREAVVDRKQWIAEQEIELLACEEDLFPKPVPEPWWRQLPSLRSCSDEELQVMSFEDRFVLAVEIAYDQDWLGEDFKSHFDREALLRLAGLIVLMAGAGTAAAWVSGTSGPPGWFVGAAAAVAACSIGACLYEIAKQLEGDKKCGELVDDAKVISKCLSSIGVGVLLFLAYPAGRWAIRRTRTAARPDRTAIENSAEAVRYPASQRPATIAHLHTPSGKSFSGRASYSGEPHPVVKQLVTLHPGRYGGACAECDAISQAHRSHEATTGRPIRSVRQARRVLKGSTIQTAKVRGAGSAEHAVPHTPCESCQPLLDDLGIRYE